MITVWAYAKINLTLEVIEKRDDGFHEIASIMQTIDLADKFSFSSAEKVKFVCSDPTVERVDLIEESVMKAVNCLREETGCTRGALVTMEIMGIPRAAGLGSSSTGPVAVVKGLNELWGLDLPVKRLNNVTAKIGSDTTFFIQGGTALSSGRGEVVIPQQPLPETWVVLLKPDFAPLPYKTAQMYKQLNQSHYTDGSATQNMITLLKRGDDLKSASMCNVFENVALHFFPALDVYRQRFFEAGAKSVHLAGAGPALFTNVPRKEEGELIVGKLRNEGLIAYLAHTL